MPKKTENYKKLFFLIKLQKKYKLWCMSKILFVNEYKYLFKPYLILDKMQKKWSVFNQHTAVSVELSTLYIH